MRYTKIRIRNFRGIEDVTLDLGSQLRSSVFTLVGLNESGKTTILEAISLFNSSKDLEHLKLPGAAARDVHELIPISKRSNFNGRISVWMSVKCDDDDEAAIRSAVYKATGITLTRPVGTFSVERGFDFKSSRVNSPIPRVVWDLEVEGTRKKGRRAHRLVGGDEWQAVVNVVRKHLPPVLYFPNFLFEVPDRIYLSDGHADAEKHGFFRAVLQDVLDATGEQTNLREHVLERAIGGAAHDMRSLESVLIKMGSHITETVFSRWDRIFQNSSRQSRERAGGKEIQVSLAHDEQGWYLQLRLKDGSDLFSISERSLGFRWFFAFLLLTEYRGFRKDGPRGALFLFDEPASNLHPSAQGQLLGSFGSFPQDATIVYTTHSHHLVNSDWLESAYVVKNEAVDYKEARDYAVRQTRITLHRYRTFAAQYPKQSTYFQPILDVLSYQPSRLENVPAVVMVEGKNDYYTLRFTQQALGNEDALYLLPGTGAGSLEQVIRLYSAWGRSFVVLLDSDYEGRKQRSRYEDMFGALVRGRVLCLEDIDPEWAGRSMEGLFEPEDQNVLQSLAYPEEPKYQKSLFNRAIQELLVTHRDVELSAAAAERFTRLLRELRERLDAEAVEFMTSSANEG